MIARRTGVAAVLTGSVVVALCSAWYLAASRDVERRVGALRDAPRRQAIVESSRIAERLSLRLEAMAEAESRRPFTDYLGDAELDALEVCGELTGQASPLAEGPADPLIWAHFQLDDVGQLTLPTLSSASGAGTRDADLIQLAILEELECASSRQLSALRRPPTEPERPARQVGRGGLVQVGAFRWHSASLQGEAAFVALRDVVTPSAVLTQGFVVRAESLERLVAGAPFPVRIVPGPPAAEAGQSRLPLAGDAWTVRLDPHAAIQRAASGADGLLREFRLRFLAGAVTALLAGGAIVVLVHQAERIAEQRARLAAAAAHELRTPLAGLQLYGEMLADGSGPPDRVRAHAARIALEAERLGRVVTNLLGFARLERGRVDLRPTVADLGEAVVETVERLRPALESNGARLEVLVDEDLPPAAFDRDSLHGILQNLLDNAEKYSRGHPDRTVSVRLRLGELGHELSVADHGPGLGPSPGRSLFGAFRSGPTVRRSGLGIGLPLVRALATAQGATLSHRPAEGGGTVFCVVFPRPARAARI